MKKKNLVLILSAISLVGCNPSAEDYADKYCDCRKEIDKYNNNDNRVKAIEKCARIYRDGMTAAENHIKEKDMNYDDADRYRKEIDQQFNKCEK